MDEMTVIMIMIIIIIVYAMIWKYSILYSINETNLFT